MKMPARLLSCVLLLAAASVAAADLPYDEHADANAQVQQALASGRRDHKPVLLLFGANWCEDCRALGRALASGENAKLVAQSFELVKVDVGNFDSHLDVVQRFGNPIAKGIPAAVIASPDGKVLFTTRAGELADARRMSDQGVYDFFKHALASLSPAKP